MNAKRMMTTVAIAASLLLGGSSPARALDIDMLIGSTANGGGALALDYDFSTAIPVSFSTEAIPFSIYTADEPGLESREDDADGFFMLDPGTQVSVEITSLESGKTAMNLNGTLLDTIGESVVLGTQDGVPPNDLHHHPTLQLVLMMAPSEFGTGTISFKLTTTSGSYTQSSSYTLVLSNAHLAPIEYDGAVYDASSVKCQATIGKEVKKLIGAKYGLLAKCLDKAEVHAAVSAVPGANLAPASNAATKACGDTLLAKYVKAGTDAFAKIQKACGGVGSGDFQDEDVRSHLDLAGCRAEEIAGASYGLARPLLAQFTAGGNPLSDALPCLGGVAAR